MIYEITLEDEKENFNMIDYLQKNGDFLFYNSKIILHTKKTKKSITRYIKTLFGREFGCMVKESNCKDVLSYPQVVYTWYAEDVATLDKQEIEQYKNEAISIFDELANKIIEIQAKERTGVKNE